MGRGNRSAQGQPYSLPFCPPQIPPGPDLGSNPGHLHGKPARNLPSYGMVHDDDDDSGAEDPEQQSEAPKPERRHLQHHQKDSII